MQTLPETLFHLNAFRDLEFAKNPSILSVNILLMLEGPSNTFVSSEQIEDVYTQNRLPLKPKPYMPLPLGSIVPGGWLKEQLKRMKDGLTGHLDTLYHEVLGQRNGWLGGDGDVWERGPYWLDGLVPLAYILNDQGLKEKAQPWIEWTINSQSEDGYFGPRSPDEDPLPQEGLQRDKAADWWPRMVMLKVLQQYYSATRDQRVITLMQKYFHYQLKNLPDTPLSHWSWWGEQRGGENLALVYWLYNITADQSLLELGELIHRQTYNWTDTFLNTDKISELFSFHGVNIAQGLKEPVVYFQQSQEAKYVDAVKKALRDLELHHGQPQGVFGADESLHGNSPVQGSELCSAVELMFSLETIMSISGEVPFMDHLERIAFNALPAQTADDFNSRQYYQQANQVIISRSERNFNTVHGHTDLCLGVLTGYPCCTVNMHQGWPKFTQSLWQATEDNGLAALVYSASTVSAKVAEGIEVQFVEESNYPFEDTIRFNFSAEKMVRFPLHLRIPGWCKRANILINDALWMEPEGNQIIKIERTWVNGDIVTLHLPMEVSSRRWYKDAASIERGPLVYALKIEENWKKVDNHDKHGPFSEIYPGTPWNYGLMEITLDRLAENSGLIEKPFDSGYPWTVDNAPLSIKLKGKRLPNWKLHNESAGPFPDQMPSDLDTIPDEEITLIPYGCTKLRITEFPVLNEPDGR